MCEMIYQPGRRRREIGTVSIAGEKKSQANHFRSTVFVWNFTVLVILVFF